MKVIPLSVTGRKYAGMYEALVDDEWYEYLIQWPWSVTVVDKTEYAMRITRDNGKQHIVQMHRVVSRATKGEEVDHIDGNGLNNQLENLRICTHSQNGMNKGRQSNNTSGYKGVSKYRNGKYRAQIKLFGNTIHLGYFDTEEEAISAYNDACVKYHGEFARPNK